MKNLLMLYRRIYKKDITIRRRCYTYRKAINEEVYKLYLYLSESLQNARYDKYLVRIDPKMVAISAAKIILINMQNACVEKGKFKKNFIEEFDNIEDEMRHTIENFKAFSDLHEAYSNDSHFESSYRILPKTLILATYFAKINVKKMIAYILNSSEFRNNYAVCKDDPVTGNYACIIALVDDFILYNSYEMFSPKNIKKFLYDEDIFIAMKKDEIFKNISYDILLSNVCEDTINDVIKKFCIEYFHSNPESIQTEIKNALCKKGIYDNPKLLANLNVVLKEILQDMGKTNVQKN